MLPARCPKISRLVKLRQPIFGLQPSLMEFGELPACLHRFELPSFLCQFGASLLEILKQLCVGVLPFEERTALRLSGLETKLDGVARSDETSNLSLMRTSPVVFGDISEALDQLIEVEIAIKEPFLEVILPGSFFSCAVPAGLPVASLHGQQVLVEAGLERESLLWVVPNGIDLNVRFFGSVARWMASRGGEGVFEGVEERTFAALVRSVKKRDGLELELALSEFAEAREMERLEHRGVKV